MRLDEILQKWLQYKGLLERDKQFFNEEFPEWMKETDKRIPDNLPDAQSKLDDVRVSFSSFKRGTHVLGNVKF